MSAVVLEGGVRAGVDVPLDGGEVRELAGADFFVAMADVADDVAVVRKEVDGGVVLAAVFGEAGEGGEAVEGEVDFHGGAGSAEVVEAGVEVGGEILRADEGAG